MPLLQSNALDSLELLQAIRKSKRIMVRRSIYIDLKYRISHRTIVFDSQQAATNKQQATAYQECKQHKRSYDLESGKWLEKLIDSSFYRRYLDALFTAATAWPNG